MPTQDPDEGLVPLFKYLPIENEKRTLEEGRPIFEDKEHVEIRSPASKDVKVFPAHAECGWVQDWETGMQRRRTYAERFEHQYRQFKMKEAQTKVGTPIEYMHSLSEGKQRELRALNIYTVEALAIIEGAELKNLGMGGRDLKNMAVEYIENGKLHAPDMQLKDEVEKLRARNAVLEEDLYAKKEREAREGEFAGMSDIEIKDYIATHTGVRPQGNPKRSTLIQSAFDCRPKQGTERVA